MAKPIDELIALTQDEHAAAARLGIGELLNNNPPARERPWIAEDEPEDFQLQ